MPTAILIDGAYFIKRLRGQYGKDVGYDSKKTAKIIFECALQHLTKKNKSRNDKNRTNANHTPNNNLHTYEPEEQEQLYRIFFYDCPPLDFKGHNPVTNRAVDFSKTEEYKFRVALHTELKKKRKVALRLGHISKHKSWTLKPDVIAKIIKNRDDLSEIIINDSDVDMSFKQKGVDMRIGLDIASLTLKRFVRRIILIAGDADFVPAAKLARREGIDFILDSLDMDVPDDLFEHIDGMKSTLHKVMQHNKIQLKRRGK